MAAIATATALVGALSACTPARISAPAPAAAPRTAAAVRVRVGAQVQVVGLDRYAAIAALTELAPGAEAPATAEAVYEAQVLVARTYAVSHTGRHAADGFDLCDTTHCQRYEPARLTTGRWAALVTAIATRTSRQVLTHAGAVIDAVFHADCGGHTADARDVWGGARPYLLARPDPVEGAHRVWSGLLLREALQAALLADPRTRVRPPLSGIAITRTDASGRAAAIRVSGGTTVEVSGDTFRSVVTAALGARALPSTRFRLERDNGGWRAAGSGFGHGVGLCQAGALGRARRGENATRILGYYFPGAIIAALVAR